MLEPLHVGVRPVGPCNLRIGFDRVRDAERFTVSEAGVVVIGKGQRFS